MKVFNIVKKVFANLIPITLLIIGREESYAEKTLSLFSLTEESVSLETFMLFSFIIGMILVYIYYPFKYEIMNRRIKDQQEHLIYVTKEITNIFSKALGSKVKTPNLNLSVRKFVPKPFYRKHLSEWFNCKKKYFEVKNFDFLTQDSYNEPCDFEVSPKQRGLVGICFAKKKMLYDDKLTEKDRMDRYNLTQQQRDSNIIGNTDFAIVKPTIKGDSVKSILSFDTKQEVEMPESNSAEIKKIIIQYTDIIGKLVSNISVRS